MSLFSMAPRRVPTSFARLGLVGLGISSFTSASLQANEPISSDPEQVELRPLVVTASESTTPLQAVLDPQVPAQPMPAQDGADLLKSVPGFSVIRKGGTDGDPVFRGMAGSRLGILLDGQVVLGGCGSRMDPPTAYVFPSAYDAVTIHKGPQSVRFGPGSSAGIVVFESERPEFSEQSAHLGGTVTAGSWGRLDLSADGAVGNETVFAQVRATRTESDDYEDGDGQEVHSRHLRWSAHAALGWTPDADTLVQISAIQSDGEAAYADRMMDGALFDRESLSLRFERERMSALLERVELEVGYNYVDHVMDNYSLRAFMSSMMMPNPTVSNPDRRTVVARGLAELRPSDSLSLTLGVDHQFNRHSDRSTMNQTLMPYETLARVRDAEFAQVGLFAESSYDLGASGKITGGVRVDQWTAKDYRENVRVSMMSSVANPTAGAKRDDTLTSGFLRYEQDLDAAGTRIFAGLGHTARFLDYWELIKNESVDSVSAFESDPERTTQVDLGLTHTVGLFDLTVSIFYSWVDDFALVQNNYSKPSGMMGTRNAVVTRGVQATTMGGEIQAGWRFSEHWLTEVTLAYARGENETDNRPLAQIPPLEGRLALSYSRDSWSAGLLVRSVAEQDRVAVGEGNIVGQDIGPSDGFTILSLHGSWQIASRVRLSAGVDNLFDTTYAEHLSRAGSLVSGYPQTTRVNEPGRTLWARLDVRF